MQIYLIVEPEGSIENSCVAVAESIDVFRHALNPGAKAYTLGMAHPKTPPGVLASVDWVSGLVAPNCIVESVGAEAAAKKR